MNEITLFIAGFKLVDKMPSFGLLSALSSGSVFLLHALIMGAIFLFQGTVPVFPLLALTIAARVFGEWWFWSQFFPTKVDFEQGNSERRSSVKWLLTKTPEAMKHVLDVIVDGVIDASLIFLAFKANSPVILLLLLFSACQGINSLLYGMLVQVFDVRFLRKFSMMFGVICLAFALEANGLLPATGTVYAKLLGLLSFDIPDRLLIIVSAKSLFCGLATCSRTTLATLMSQRISSVKNHT